MSTKLQSHRVRSEPAWLAKIFGGSLSDPGKSVGGLVTQGSGFIAAFLASLWSGGRAVFSVLSLLVITPVVAFYLLLDWDRMVATVDGWIPLQHRDTVHGAGARHRRGDRRLRARAGGDLPDPRRRSMPSA